MFRLDVVHVQYLVFMAVAAVLLLVGLTLGYFALWRPRLDQAPVAEDEYRPTSVKEWFGFIPWIIVGVVVFLFVWAIAYLVLAAKYPPNI